MVIQYLKVDIKLKQIFPIIFVKSTFIKNYMFYIFSLLLKKIKTTVIKYIFFNYWLNMPLEIINDLKLKIYFL